MKITKKYLQKIINEETMNVLAEMVDPLDLTPAPDPIEEALQLLTIPAIAYGVALALGVSASVITVAAATGAAPMIALVAAIAAVFGGAMALIKHLTLIGAAAEKECRKYISHRGGGGHHYSDMGSGAAGIGDEPDVPNRAHAGMGACIQAKIAIERLKKAAKKDRKLQKALANVKRAQTS